MNLDLLGHACVLLRSSEEETLLIDPYESGQFDGRIGYAPIDITPDWVVSTHHHADHAAFHAVPGEFRLVESGVAGPFEIIRHSAWHDEYAGRRRGGTVDVLEIRAEGFRIAHLSDVGHSPITSIVRSLRGVDVLLVPVGGFFTIGAAQAWEWIERVGPRCTIPMHYRTAACQLPIRGVDEFAAWMSASIDWRTRPTHVEAELPPTLFLEHSRNERAATTSGSRA